MISVITATYNHAPFIQGALESVHRQQFRDWEHIVVDDGSTDATPGILAGLQAADPQRLRVFRTPNRGFAAAMNHGLAQARGEYVAFLDSDDEYLPDHLSTLLETLGSGDFALGRYLLVNCTQDSRPTLADFFNPGREIPVEEAEYGTGLFFGKRQVFLDLDGFRQVPLCDTDLFVRMDRAGYTWHRADHATYRYFFGRVPNNMAARERDALRH